MEIIKLLEKLSERIYEKNIYLYIAFDGVIVWMILFVLHLFQTNGYISRKVVVLFSAVLLVACVMVCIVAALYRRMPKFADKETGILFVIRTNSAEEREVVNNMFVKKVAKLFNDEFYQVSNVRLLDPYNTELFIEAREEKKRQFIKDSNAKLVIWGTIEKGKTRGKNAYFIKLDSGVAHSQISSNISKMLSYDMAQVMQPIREICVFEDDNKLGFDLVADATEIIAQYIMAEACYFSGNINRSIEIFCSLGTSLSRDKRNVNYKAWLRHISKRRLTELYTIMSSNYYFEFRRYGKNEELEKMRKCLDEVLRYNGASTAYYEQMALYYFCYDRNVDEARKCIEECFKTRRKSIIAMYDRAFLKFYSKYSPYVANKCYSDYVTIFRKNKDYELIQEIEDFIAWVITEEPEKAHLNWLLSLLANERGDFCLSNKYLNDFLQGNKFELNEGLRSTVESLKEKNDACMNIV